jgi:hypothetical protein
MTWLEWFELWSYVVTIIGILISLFESAYLLEGEDEDFAKHVLRIAEYMPLQSKKPSPPAQG